MAFTGRQPGRSVGVERLIHARDIALAGDVSGSVSFDGSANATITATVADDSHDHVITNVDGLQAALDAKAPLASPALTGTPTAPTAALGTNTTQIATTAFVKTEVANLIDAAPTALDTLNELAAALGDDANYATTTATALGNRVLKVTSTDNALVRFDGTDGSVQNSSWTCSDTGNLGYNIASPVSKLHLAASPEATTAYGTISLGGGIFDGVSAGKYSGTAQGTCLAINELSGYAGFLLDFQVAGVRKFSLTTSTMNFTGGYIIAQSFQSSVGEIGTNTIIPLNLGLKSSNSFTTANTSQIVLARATMAQASGSNAAVKITPTYNQVSSSANNTDLLINRTETAVGSGAQYLIDAQVGGISKFCVTNGGNLLTGGKTSVTSNGGDIQVSRGISFPATQVACSDPNTLDDYEEGTFTPTLLTTSGTPIYSYQQGYYTKIGRQVFGGGIIGITNNSALTGSIKISVPFVVSGENYGYTGGFSSDGSGWTWPLGAGGNTYSITWMANNGSACLTFTCVAISATEVTYGTTGIGNTWFTRFGFSYYTIN